MSKRTRILDAIKAAELRDQLKRNKQKVQGKPVKIGFSTKPRFYGRVVK